MHELPRVRVADAMIESLREKLLDRRVLVIAIGLVVVGLLVFALATGGDSGGSGDNGGSAETTATPSEPVVPPPPELSRPETAVYSYLIWISFAYRILNSDVASMTFSPYQEVRVNSYVMYNVQEERAIDQQLVSFEVRSKTATESTATVAATESWVYRYIDPTTNEYSSPEYEISYESTYTLQFVADHGWVVHLVEVNPLGEVR